MIQLQFLNYLLDSNDISILTANNLNKDFFPDYKDEWEFVEKHVWNYGKIPDKETFANKFKKFEFIKVNEPPSFLIQNLYSEYNTRKMAEGYNKVRELLINGETDKAIELTNQLTENLQTGLSIQSVDIIKDQSRYDEYLKKVEGSDEYFVTTGFPELDAITGGFNRKEELAVIAARTNNGKSWIMAKCAVAAAKAGLRVGIYSGEMGVSEEAYRIDTLIGHVSNFSIAKGKPHIEVKYKKYLENLPSLVKGSIRILTPAMINGPATVNALRAFIEKDNLDILFVDQLSLLEDIHHEKVHHERMANISKDLKNLQVMKRIPIIEVSQLNRTKNEDGSVDNTQISQSDRIAQDATMIIMVQKDKETVKLCLTKSRASENNKVLTYFTDLDNGEFEFVPEEETDVKDKLNKQRAQQMNLDLNSDFGDDPF